MQLSLVTGSTAINELIILKIMYISNEGIMYSSLVVVAVVSSNPSPVGCVKPKTLE
jgi:hypothetical protein